MRERGWANNNVSSPAMRVLRRIVSSCSSRPTAAHRWESETVTEEVTVADR